ncbi:hypothetical protein EPO15_08145 [bacterium]|nr:MAG: hypothetical protein EPO15_08145 [bacterium]
MGLTARAVSSALLVALSVPAFAATKAEVKAKAGEVIKKVEAKLPAGTAELKAKAAATLSTLPADAARALQGAKGQQNFTPDQLTQIQAQSGQILTNLTADPRAAAAAAQAGVTSQKLNALQAQTAAAVQNAKGADGKPSVEAMGQQAREFMKSEKAQQFGDKAAEAAARASEDPKLNAAALKFKTEAKAALEEVKAKGPALKESAKAAMTPENAQLFKERAAAVANDPQVRTEAAGLLTNAQKALIKFCKKYEGKAAAPARCRKPKPAPEPAAE